ncbi:maleylpyruvate isomerase family mycothiol-dependent enzyme [Actinomadura sp. K4S16]|uniref:maleylpyruvate isomerase family mycothiol-dependent enzyme n=1 Tax=Actinomadura sp. K4S16 TaxID=1316147 RepID=UPI00190F95C9|nr:maleylpyruvate isomerase family mycothiol-dependent enzyme [Actinomadura sp. K4S16]
MASLGEAVSDVWPMVHTERAALIEDLSHLDAEQWEGPSLCDGWTVHDVVAHLVDTAHTTRLGFVVRLAQARFDFHRQNAQEVERERGASSLPLAISGRQGALDEFAGSGVSALATAA